MKTKEKMLTASEFKAKCLRILDELDASGIIVTKKGRPIAKVMPVPSANNEQFFGSMKGKIKIKGNIFSAGMKWNAQSRYPRSGFVPGRSLEPERVLSDRKGRSGHF